MNKILGNMSDKTAAAELKKAIDANMSFSTIRKNRLSVQNTVTAQTAKREIVRRSRRSLQDCVFSVKVQRSKGKEHPQRERNISN